MTIEILPFKILYADNGYRLQQFTFNFKAGFRMTELMIRPFRIEDQALAKAIILAGMKIRWGSIDHSMNPDLNDIQASYIDNGHLFFVGEVDGKLVATGALTVEAEGVWRLERMSVLEKWQRHGFGRKFTAHLINTARSLNAHTIVTETERNWHSAIALYEQAGFQKTFVRGTEQHMSLDLTTTD